MNSVLRVTEFLCPGINTSVLNVKPNVYRTEGPLSTFSLFSCVSDMPDGVC